MPILLTWPNCSSQASRALKPAASAGNDSVPTNLPSGSSAATTWVSRWVSTPPVIPGGASTMVIAVPTFLNVDGDGTAVPDRSDGRIGLFVQSRPITQPRRRGVPYSMCDWKSSADDTQGRLMTTSQAKSPSSPKAIEDQLESGGPYGTL